jgi:site-specific recombinase XerD
MTDQLPAISARGALAMPADTRVVPSLIANEDDTAGWRYVEFFAANIANDHTRRAYARACSRFFAWCEQGGLTLTTIRPFDVGAWVKELQEKHGAPGVKQQLAAVRMLFDWLVIGQVVPMNPAAAVREPKHVVKTGKTPVLDAVEWRKLIDSDLRDRARHPHLLFRPRHRGAAHEGRGPDRSADGAG